MNTPDWMMVATADAPRRAKSARHRRRSGDRRGLTVDVMLAFAAMVAALSAIYLLNSLLLR
jgi:hypothetical protein